MIIFLHIINNEVFNSIQILMWPIHIKSIL